MMTFTYLLYLLLIIAPGLHDSLYPPLAFSGAWVIQMDAAAWDGSYHETSSSGATLTIEFYGSGIALFGVAKENGGTADVCLNGDCVVASWDAPVNLYTRNIITYSDIPEGERNTLTVTAAGDGFISIDAVYIAPHASVLMPGGDQWVDVREDGSAIANIISRGEQAIFLALVAVVILMGISTSLLIWERIRNE